MVLTSQICTTKANILHRRDEKRHHRLFWYRLVVFLIHALSHIQLNNFLNWLNRKLILSWAKNHNDLIKANKCQQLQAEKQTSQKPVFRLQHVYCLPWDRASVWELLWALPAGCQWPVSVRGLRQAIWNRISPWGGQPSPPAITSRPSCTSGSFSQTNNPRTWLIVG